MSVDDPGAPPPIPDVQALIEGGTFEDALGALESVAAHLERGRLSIDDSVTWYELGLGLSRRCSDLLHQAELRISTIEQHYATDAAARDLWNDD